jgi:hypothetical protein
LSVCALKSMSGGRRCEDTRRDPAACFIVKQVGLGFPSFASKLERSDGGWCMWHHHGGRVEVKQKMVGSMASGATQWKSDQTTFH